VRAALFLGIAFAVTGAVIYAVVQEAGEGDHEFRTPWGLDRLAADGGSVTIVYAGGDQTCFELERVEKDETSTRVELAVVLRYDAPGHGCN
jgi:hypothetical protein